MIATSQQSLYTMIAYHSGLVELFEANVACSRMDVRVCATQMLADHREADVLGTTDSLLHHCLRAFDAMANLQKAAVDDLAALVLTYHIASEDGDSIADTVIFRRGCRDLVG